MLINVSLLRAGINVN